MHEPPRDRRRDAIAALAVGAALALVVTMAAHDKADGTRVPDLSGRAAFSVGTLLEVRGLGLGDVTVSGCPRLALPKTVLKQEPEAGNMVALGSRIDITVCRG
jgi:beta-lactam-binding protein with PASTA domain